MLFLEHAATKHKGNQHKSSFCCSFSKDSSFVPFTPFTTRIYNNVKPFRALSVIMYIKGLEKVTTG